jgi:prepilin-type N-terminal cleavage/methylation domain-containing protein
VRQRLAEARKNQSGFTLIELLIVIVILGVLAGIVVFAVAAFTSDGKTTACKADKKSVEVAAEAFRAKTGAYPAAAADLTNAPAYLKSTIANGTGVVTGTLTAGGTC